MICLDETIGKYRSAELYGIVNYDGHDYIRLAMTQPHVLKNGLVKFQSVCQGVDEDFSGEKWELKSPISQNQVVVNAQYKTIQVGQFAKVPIDSSHSLACQIIGLNDFSWRGTDLIYRYYAQLIKPLTKSQMRQMIKQERAKHIRQHYHVVKNSNLIELKWNKA